MTRRIYLTAFALVSACVMFNAISALLFWARIPLPYTGLSFIPDTFGHPLPAMLGEMLPWQVKVALFWTFAFLIGWRLAHFVRNKAIVTPSSLTRIPQVILLISLASLAVGLLGLCLSILLKAGSGVPAAMLMLPAVFLLSPTVAWIEARAMYSHIIEK